MGRYELIDRGFELDKFEKRTDRVFIKYPNYNNKLLVILCRLTEGLLSPDTYLMDDISELSIVDDVGLTLTNDLSFVYVAFNDTDSIPRNKIHKIMNILSPEFISEKDMKDVRLI